MKVAVFAREDLIDKIYTFANKQDHIQILPFTYQKTKNIVNLIEKAFMCDVYLFTEPLAYLYVKDKLEKKRVPAVQVDFDEYMILNTIFNDNRSLTRFSVDIPNKQPVHMMLKEWNQKENDVYVYDYGREPSFLAEDITAFHQQLWEEGKIDYALTSSRDIMEQLLQIGVPVSSITLPFANLANALEEAAALATLNSYDNTQVVTGIVCPKVSQFIKDQEHEQLHSSLLQFGQNTGTSVIEAKNDKFMLLGTNGLLDHIKNNYGKFPLLQEVSSKVNAPINIAFGLGLTADEAHKHACLALEKCQKAETSIAYVINERGDTIGPLGVEKHIDTSRLYQALIHKARLNNELSYNFIDFIKVRNNEPFSSHDIANYYKVTKRSAERTVNKLLSGEVIKVSGEERPYVKGRPRKLFTLNL